MGVPRFLKRIHQRASAAYVHSVARRGSPTEHVQRLLGAMGVSNLDWLCEEPKWAETPLTFAVWATQQETSPESPDDVSPILVVVNGVMSAGLDTNHIDVGPFRIIFLLDRSRLTVELWAALLQMRYAHRGPVLRADGIREFHDMLDENVTVWGAHGRNRAGVDNVMKFLKEKGGFTDCEWIEPFNESIPGIPNIVCNEDIVVVCTRQGMRVTEIVKSPHMFTAVYKYGVAPHPQMHASVLRLRFAEKAVVIGMPIFSSDNIIRVYVTPICNVNNAHVLTMVAAKTHDVRRVVVFGAFIPVSAASTLEDGNCLNVDAALGVDGGDGAVEHLVRGYMSGDVERWESAFSESGVRNCVFGGGLLPRTPEALSDETAVSWLGAVFKDRIQEHGNFIVAVQPSDMETDYFFLHRNNITLLFATYTVDGVLHAHMLWVRVMDDRITEIGGMPLCTTPSQMWASPASVLTSMTETLRVKTSGLRTTVHIAL
jgi:hypothetical protein